METATDSEIQYDEFGEPIPTEEELAKQRADQEAERLKTEQALKLAGGMTGLEAQLPNTLPTQAAPMTATQPPPEAPIAPPLNLPVSRGRMYMGPVMAPGQEQAFMQSPSGTSQNLMPPPSGPPLSALEQAQAMDRPPSRGFQGDRTISINPEPPYSDASVANQQNAMRFEAMKKFDAGDRTPEVMAAALGRSATPGKRYNVSGVGLVDENGRVITAHPDSPQTRVIPGVGLVDSTTGKVITPIPQTQTVSKHIPAVAAIPGSPEIPGRKGIFGIGARAAVPATPGVPEQLAQTITSKVPVEPPAPAPAPASSPKAVPSVGEVRNGYRFKGGDPAKKSNWEKV